MNVIEALKIAHEVLEGKTVDPVKKRQAYLIISGHIDALSTIKGLLERKEA